jgi:hypothetical protein
MEQTRIGIDNFFTYDGLYPTTLKKVDPTDIAMNSFQVYKNWTITSGSVTSSALPLTAIYTDTLPILDTELTYNDAANIDGSLQTVIYYSLNHLFYRYKNEPFVTYGPPNITKTKKALFQSASVLSIPQVKIGERIKSTSFTFTSSVSGSFASDSYENIYDTSFNTAAIVSGAVFYEGFNEYFDISRTPYNTSGVTYVSGIPTTTGQQRSIGYAANFNGSGSIDRILDGLYDRDHDYAISFFVSASDTNVFKPQILLSKRTSIHQKQWPFEIVAVGTSPSIVCTVGGNRDVIYPDIPGVNLQLGYPTLRVTASISNSWTHILFQKSGSAIQLYTNGTLVASQSSTLLQPTTNPLSASIRIDNNDPLKIGGFSISGSQIFNAGYPTDIKNLLHDSNYIGKLDEIRIFNKALTSTEIGYLANRTEGGTMLQTRNVGTIMPAQGLVVFSSPDYRFQNLLNAPFTASYKSTKTIHELSALVRIDAGEFNLSTNVTLTKDDNYTYQSFVTGSNFTPYITTIGLYNANGQLLAIGKLAQPIKKRDDVDLNFLIRLDLDRNILFSNPGFAK